MNDPMAPTNYCFENQDKLDACLEKLHEQAEALGELSFGDAATTIQRALFQIEHHRQVDGWTRISRSALNYLVHRIGELPLPHVSVRHPMREGDTVRLSIDFSVPLAEGESITEFVKEWDPGTPFDRECPTCHAKPKNPCKGSVDQKIGVHANRRFR
jgi:hypothetical protein